MKVKVAALIIVLYSMKDTATSTLRSFFGSPQLSLVERMTKAELGLSSYIGRFGGSGDQEPPMVEIFDTEFPKSMLRLETSSFFDIFRPSYWKNTEEKKLKEETYHLHGIKVTSRDYRKTNSNNEEHPLVLLHGYCNGALYFYRNLFGLSKHHFGGTVYALDLLGWGLSSRPKFQFPSERRLSSDDKRIMSEEFFVESLEAWRKSHGIEKMTLSGHSMGGYLSVAYCEKYPQHVDRLILLSPVGVPDNSKEDRLSGRDLSFRFRLALGLATKLWNAGVTPSSFVRSLPESQGQKLVSKYVENRLNIRCPDESSNLAQYLYLNAALPGSGENCLNKILDPIAYAKKPLLYRIPNLKVDKVSIIYGHSDWMQPEGGMMVKHQCQQQKASGRQNVPDVRVFIVRNAGHLLMLENWEEFNSAVILAATDEHVQKLPYSAPLPYEYK